MSGYGIDVVIPVFNGQRYIAKALQSVQSQTLPVSRIIVVDDGSTDATVRAVEDLMRGDERIVCLKRPHEGVSAARNAGIAASSAPFVAFLDADDIWLPEKLERQLAAFERGGGEVGFVHSSYFFINADGDPLPGNNIVPPKQRGDIFMPLLLDGYVLSGSASSVVVRRDVLDKAGHFDAQLFHGEDWDLWIRLAHISKVDFTPDAVVGIRVHNESAQRRRQVDREIYFFNQHLLVYDKWEQAISGDQRLKKNLARHACNLALPLLRKPWRAQAFYTSLAKSDSSLARSIFPNAFQFWRSMALGVLRILWWRTRRTVGLNER